jgi:dolichyl-phosphate beta-glucosyltransferase
LTEVTGGMVVVVPCFNEERRLDETAFLAFAQEERLTVLFVDDGSSDGTRELLLKMADRSDSVEVLVLPRNVGKGEAIRRGVLQSMEQGASLVGYLDADLAAPPQEFLRMQTILESQAGLSVVMGSRISRLGSNIDRKGIRHAIGRVYATGASLALGIPVYDTQCGAKLFRVSPTVAAAFATPFGFSWAFDIQVINRLLIGTASVPGLSLEEFLEVPLEVWRDVPDSKVGVWGGISAFLGLFPVAVARRRAARKRGTEVRRDVGEVVLLPQTPKDGP